MKVIYFKRNQPSGFHIHAGSYARYFYVPGEKDVVLFEEQHGTFGGKEFYK